MAVQNTLNAIPKHARITADLRNRIHSGRYRVGSTLPSRRDLAVEYGVAVGTVQNALLDLIGDGTLSARGRWGTVVSRQSHPGSDSANGREYAIDTSEPVGEDFQSHVSECLPLTTTLKAVVGIILTGPEKDKADPWRQNALPPVERAISAAGGATLYAEQAIRGSEKRDVREMVAELKAEGANSFVLITHGDRGLHEPLLDFLRIERDPIVWLGISPAPLPLMSVYFDSKDAGFQATDHLLERGFRRLLFYSPCEAEWVSMRVAGAAERFSLSRSTDCKFEPIIAPVPQDDLGHEYFYCTDAAYEAGRKLFRDGLKWDAIIAANDSTAVGLIKAAAERGFEAGRDFAIIGFDDQPESRMLGLSTLRPPMDGLGQNAARLIVRALNGDRSCTRTCLHSDLIVRKSTMRFKNVAN